MSHSFAPAQHRQNEASSRIAALEEEVKRVGPSPLGAQLLAEIGRLWEEALGNEREAALAYRRSLRIDPSYRPTLQAMRRLFSRDGGWHLALPLLDRELELCHSEEEAASLLLDRGKALLHLFREEEAIASFRQALRAIPGHLGAMAQLERLAALGLGAPWLHRLCKEEAAKLEGIGAVRILMAGALHLERLGAKTLALDLQRAAFRADPADAPARHALMERLECGGDHEALLQLLEVEAAIAPTNAILHRISQIKLHLGDEDGALEALERAPEPYDPLVAEALGKLFERGRAWERLAAVREQQARASSDPAHRISLFLELAQIFEERLDAPLRAIDCYCEVLQHDETHGPALAGLGKLQHQVGDWEGLLATVEREAQAAKNPKERLAHAFKAAMILEERLQDKERAILAYERLLAQEPAYTPALRSLGRLYAQRGRWEKLVAMHQREAAVAGTERAAAALLFKAGELLEQKICDEERAVRAYRDVLDLIPDHFSALSRLASIYRSQNAWGELVEVLEREAALRTEPAGKALLLYEAAQIAEAFLGDLDKAASRYRGVLGLNEDDAAALRALDRILARQGDHHGRVPLLERLATLAQPSERPSLFASLAWLKLYRLGDAEGAASACKAALQIDPRHQGAAGLLSLARTANGAASPVGTG